MSRVVGNRGEDMAADYLVAHGWRIVDRNVHYRYGEIDILARRGNELVLVEVKVKTSLRHGFAVEQITPAKQRTLRKLAKQIMMEYNKPVRVDVITIDNFRTRPELMHYQNAVEGDL